MPRRRRPSKDAEPGERMAQSEPAEPGLGGALGPSTTAVHAGEPRPKPAHALATPIIQTATYTFANTQELIDHFVWCIVNDRPLVQTVVDSTRVLEAVFAAEESARTGRAVRL